jgi:ABC-2 type transport system permease protein
MNALHLLLRYIQTSLKAQFQYPGSVVMLGFAQFLATAIEVIAIWGLFERFGVVKGWRFGEVCLFYGLVSLSFALSEFLTRGFDVFGTEFVRSGGFDRILLRPRSAALQLIGHDFRLSRLGRVLQAAMILTLATTTLPLAWDARMVAIAAWATTGGVALFMGILILQATLAFWTVESLEVANVLTHGGVQAGQFPLSLYSAWLRNFLIYIVPIGCVAYYPALAILSRSDPLGAPDWWLPVAPALGFVFLAVSFLAWRMGVARYTSTGT